MMRPRTSVLVVGHPLVAVPLTLLFIGVAADCAYQSGFNLFTVGVLFGLGWIGNCFNAATRYRAWRREWDALDPEYRPRNPWRGAGKSLLALVGGIFALWLIATFNDPDSPARTVAWLLPVGLLAIGVLRMARRGRRSGAKAPKDFIVTQAVKRPLPAPQVADAYARLPDYCRPILSSEPARKERP